MVPKKLSVVARDAALVLMAALMEAQSKLNFTGHLDGETMDSFTVSARRSSSCMSVLFKPRRVKSKKTNSPMSSGGPVTFACVVAKVGCVVEPP